MRLFSYRSRCPIAYTATKYLALHIENALGHFSPKSNPYVVFNRMREDFERQQKRKLEKRQKI